MLGNRQKWNGVMSGAYWTTHKSGKSEYRAGLGAGGFEEAREDFQMWLGPFLRLCRGTSYRANKKKRKIPFQYRSRDAPEACREVRVVGLATLQVIRVVRRKLVFECFRGLTYYSASGNCHNHTKQSYKSQEGGKAYGSRSSAAVSPLFHEKLPLFHAETDVCKKFIGASVGSSPAREATRLRRRYLRVKSPLCQKLGFELLAQ